MTRTLAIGDIHGCSTALDRVLELIQPRPDDRIVTLGDYVDRGPDTAGVIDRLIRLRDQYEMINLRGNHEIMMLEARKGAAEHLWLGYGGEQALASYGGRFENAPAAHWDFLENTRPYFETDTHIFVHANVYPYLPLAEQPDAILFWERFQDFGPHESGKIVICGHTAQKLGVPLALPHVICLDTWVYGNGWLTCYDLKSGRVWQAKQDGETRTAYLDEIALGLDE